MRIYYLNYSGIEKNFIIDQFEIEEKKIKSKRKNFIEFNGIISIKNNFGSYLTILHNNTKRNLNLKILQNKLSFNLKENNNFAYLSTKKNSKVKKINFKIPFQSEITKFYCQKIFSKNKIDLPSLEEHYLINKDIFKNIERICNSKKSKKNKLIPIT